MGKYLWKSNPGGVVRLYRHGEEYWLDQIVWQVQSDLELCNFVWLMA